MMPSSSLSRLAAATVLGACAVSAHASDFAFSGQLVYNTDLARVTFDVGPVAGDIKVWTDSWQAGLNFDPTATLWKRSGGDYAFVAENDDDDTIGAGQGSFDSGFAFSSLASGHYLVTVGASPNFAAGSHLSDGFSFDGSTPVKIADWNQPSYDINANDQKGTLWRLHLTGVQMAAAVPEPSTYAMILAGLGVLVVLRRRSRK